MKKDVLDSLMATEEYLNDDGGVNESSSQGPKNGYELISVYKCRDCGRYFDFDENIKTIKEHECASCGTQISFMGIKRRVAVEGRNSQDDESV